MDHGIDVTVLEKLAGPGGRISMMKAGSEEGDDVAMFDHGTQYFRPCDAGFCRLVNSWIDDGLVQPWEGGFVDMDSDGKVEDELRVKPRYVGTPTMNAIAQHLASDLAIEFDSTVTELRREGEQWRLATRHGNDSRRFDQVILACPPAQASVLIGDQSTLSSKIQSIRMRPCWAWMLADDALADIRFDAALVDHPVISWIARNDRKPGRRNSPAWVVHASADWSQQHMDNDSGEVLQALPQSFESLVQKKLEQPRLAEVYLWRDAVAENPLECESLFDPTQSIGVCGDWCSGKRWSPFFSVVQRWRVLPYGTARLIEGQAMTIWIWHRLAEQLIGYVYSHHSIGYDTFLCFVAFFG